MGKRQEAALETKRKILEAINALLLEKNAEDISIEEITTRAGVAKGSFYTHFKRKEDAVCDAALAKYADIQQQALNPEGCLREKLSDYLKQSAAIIDAYGLQMAQGWMRSATSPVSDDSQGLQKYQFDRANILEMLTIAQKQGKFAEDALVEALSNLVMHVYYGAVATWCITDGKTDLRQSIETFCQYGLQAILQPYVKEELS